MAGESLRDYFIRFLFKTDKAGAKEAESTIKGLTHSIERLTAVSFAITQVTGAIREVFEPFARLGEFISHTAEEADQLRDLAERTGIASDEIEKFGFIAKISGTSQETFLTGMRHLEKAMGEVATGSKEASETFARLGVSIRDPSGRMRTVQEMLPELSEAFSRIPSHAEKSATAMKLFGRAGQELLPMLERGADEIRELQIELELLGGVTSEEFLDSSERYVDNMTKMTAVWKGIRQAIAGPVLKAINDVTDGFIEWWKTAGALIRSRISEWTFQLVTSFEAFGTTLRRLAPLLLATAALLNAPLLVMLGMRLAIGLLVDDFANWMAGNDSLIGRAIANWEDWLTEIGQTNPALEAVMRAFGEAVEWVHGQVVQLEVDWENFLKIIQDDSFSIGDTIKAFFSSLADFMLAPLVDTWERLRDLIFDTLMGAKRLAQAVGLEDLAKSLGGAASGVMGGAGVSHTIHEPVIPAGMGGAGASNSSVSAPVNINIQAAPGMDERKLAEEAARAAADHMDSVVRTGFNQLVPERY